VAPGILGKFFGFQPASGPEHPTVSGQRISRRSTGFNEFIKSISRQDGLRILDLGATSPANITFMTGMGHKFHQEDLLRLSADKDLLVPNGNGERSFDTDRFLRENLNFEREEFDAVMFWDLADYLPEGLVKPVIERVHVGMKPGGILLAFFHTKDAGPQEPFYRYHIVSKEAVDMQPAPAFKLQRVFANRHVENLFRDFASIKFFLGRDNLRDVLVIR
jgi:SAM-dependent methyltransferase